MSSSNDPIDKQLRQHFQRVFDEYEVQPADSLKERIWANVSRDRTGYAVLITGIILLVGTGIYYQSLLRSYQTKVQRQQTHVATHPTPVASHPAALASVPHGQPYERQAAEATHPVVTESLPVSPDGQTKVSPVLIHSRPKRTVSEEPTHTPGSDPRVVLVTQASERQRVTTKQKLQTPQTSLVLSGSGTDFDDATRPHQSTVPTLAMQTTERAATPLTTRTEQSEQAKESAETETRSWQALRPLALRPTHGLLAQISRPVRLSTPGALSQERSITPKAPIRWLVGVAPVSTFQWMTVVAKPQTYVQSVGDPAALSGPTWGYQVSGGVEWKQIDFQLSFGQIRRWAYYELSTSTFQVEHVGTKQYQITRLDDPVAENVSLTMLGADVRKQYALGGDRSPYFVRLGGQASYVPATRQSLFWANAAVGLTLPLGREYQFQFGPTVEYGFSRLWSTERQLIIHPYLVGASLTLRPAKP